MLTWALSEAIKGTLPETCEPLVLPSGQKVQAAGAAAWLIAGNERALRLRGQPFPDCEAAFLILRQDLKQLALACAEAWVSSDAEAWVSSEAPKVGR